MDDIYIYIYRHISKAFFCNGTNLLIKLLICSKAISENEHFYGGRKWPLDHPV